MGQSKEFPQFAWVTPKSFTSGRKSGQPTVIFIHTTDGSEGLHSAEDGAAYDARRTDGVSTHFFCDQDSTIQCVNTGDEAHAARSHGNDVGIQIEVCGRAAQTIAQWGDAASAGAVEQAARVGVALRKKYGKARFPLVNLTPAQLRSGLGGFAEHKDATLAWPEDKGDHTDPGPNFPWATLFARIVQLEREAAMATDPTANAIAGRDIDPSPTTSQTWAGADFTTLARTGYLANKFAPEVKGLIEALGKRVEDIDDELDSAGASALLAVGILQSFVADPAQATNPLYEVVRRAVRDELGVQAPQA